MNGQPESLEERLALQIIRQREKIQQREREAARDVVALPDVVRAVSGRANEAKAKPRTPEVVPSAVPALQAAGVPLTLAELACSRQLQLEAPAIVSLRAAQAEGRVFVVLAGSIGVGKSVAAAAWLRAAQAGVDPMWESRALSRWIHAHELARLSGFEVDGLGALERVPFLVVDDLGVEYLDGKGWLGAAVDSLVYQRHGNRRATVLTTNLSGADFVDRYGPRVASRLHEIGAFIEVAGDDMRRATTRRDAST